MITNFNRVMAHLYVIKFVRREISEGLRQKFFFLFLFSALLCGRKIVNLYICITALLVMLSNRSLICMHLTSEIEILVFRIYHGSKYLQAVHGLNRLD